MKLHSIIYFLKIFSVNLKNICNVQWLLPPESEISKWFYVKERYFPSAGEPGFIMIKQIDIAREFGQIENLVTKLSGPLVAGFASIHLYWQFLFPGAEQSISSVSPWEQGFKTYVNKIKQTNEPFEELIKNETYFREKFTQFLYSPRGGIFQVNISHKRNNKKSVSVLLMLMWT